ncbi:hypothetical protein MPLB_20025 [Mesorhizobium sp. ORS 3324]|nr:hypothetical protein MPLB_20025 [Mesorhizobium sp. ORS 3324]
MIVSSRAGAGTAHGRARIAGLTSRSVGKRQWDIKKSLFVHVLEAPNVKPGTSFPTQGF